jgi:hypothetical protein
MLEADSSRTFIVCNGSGLSAFRVWSLEFVEALGMWRMQGFACRSTVMV